MAGSILVISGDLSLRQALVTFAGASGLDADAADLGTRGIERLQYGTLPRAVLIDLALSGVPAQAVLRAVGGRYPDLPIMMIGEVTDLEASVLLKLGASAIVRPHEIPTALPGILEAVATRPAAPMPFRAEPRIPVKLRIDVQTGGAPQAATYQTRDLSLSGAFIPMPVPLPQGARLQARLFPPSGEPVLLTAEVARRVERSDLGVAVRFVDWKEPERQKLAALLSQVGRRGRSGAPALASTSSPEAGVALARLPSAAPSAPATAGPVLNLDELLTDALALAAAPDSTAPAAPSPAIDDEDTVFGERLLRIGSFALARARFAKALTRDPDNTQLQFLHALAGAREAMKQKQHERALECYSQLLALDPAFTEALEAARTLGEKVRVEKKGLLQKLFTGS